MMGLDQHLVKMSDLYLCSELLLFNHTVSLS